LPRRKKLSRLSPLDIDRFLTAEGERLSARTLSSVCTSIRCFLRFLHATGWTAENLATCVIGLTRNHRESPPRGLPWQDVRRIIAAVDRRSAIGKRDYTMLVLMAAYALGGAEIRAIALEDIDWRRETLRLVRRKTGHEFLLPLIGPIAHALSSYLRTARPRCASAREIFVGVCAPHRPLSRGALHLVVRKYAARAGVTAPVLGTHSLRFSHVWRQIEMSAPPVAISDILGHTDARSSSTYADLPATSLNAISLPVP
jgi:site-specific recombinase XerD